MSYAVIRTDPILKFLTSISVNLPRFETLELTHREAQTLSMLYAEYKSSKKVSLISFPRPSELLSIKWAPAS